MLAALVRVFRFCMSLLTFESRPRTWRRPAYRRDRPNTSPNSASAAGAGRPFRWEEFPMCAPFSEYLAGPLHNFFLGQSIVESGDEWPFLTTSDGCFGTVRTGWVAQFRAPKRPKRPRFGPLKCRWVSLGVTWEASSGALRYGNYIPKSHLGCNSPRYCGWPGLCHATRPKCAVVRDGGGLIGQVIWHSSDGLHGTVPGAKNGENRPEWRPEVSLGVVRCHLAGGVAPTRSCGGGNQPLSPPGSPPRIGGGAR